MQPRLVRSRTDVMIGGVCGGLAEYFNIDPVIVRLIFVLVTLTSGLGLLIYPVLWIIMPKAGLPVNSSPYIPQSPEEWHTRMRAIGQEANQLGQEVREVLLREQPVHAQRRVDAPSTYGEIPPASSYRFDPLTGEPIQPQAPTTGQTISLHVDPSNLQHVDQRAPAQPVPPRKRWHRIGILLIGFGVLFFADQIGIDLDLIFPLMMILGGFLLLFRK